ncbi:MULTISPECIES: 3-isopropylmalate dehydratase large subunit [unclassified Pseudodesulfovibrio]|uniref:3-isopropylmalate dehydratase large subunit n=1 Tax=unclassified Pseudodesulfovibrio TaxID=2661612 RepID=UPI000FEB8073|nr:MULTISPECIES: 3-isopropylmalate dehydratase large subunit [unclassified Pseudodesulfovibrio]MCJ2164085.1 3-isopropylmalate dehydratase large subunit [Pseudodesulfovibrio sp. S3-i]RWU05284.1 3-isopropylmalate dehydratase large subunit [Pseudodesulfovibrio sp. S3]
MGQTLAEKILQKHTDQEVTGAGQIVQCKVDMVLANDITAPLAIKSFKAMGAKKVFDRNKVALVCDHFTPNKDIDSAEQVKVVREFAEEMGVTHYYECGEVGVEHALLPEKGIVGPGDVVVGADSHTCTYGGLGAFATGMGSTDIGAAMALGETWFKVPPTIRVNLTGTPKQYVGAKDFVLNQIGQLGVSGALYKALEYSGEVVDNMSVEGRMTIANMAIEAGGKVGLFPVDAKTMDYAAKAGFSGGEAMVADADAVYERVLNIDVTDMDPQVACPHLPDNVKPVDETSGLKIHQAVIGSCTNGRIEDLRVAAAILKGRKVDPKVRCIILPATPAIWKACMKEGLMEIFMDAGCIVGPPTCGPCLGGHMGILAGGERVIATTNRNFKGRMGSLESEVFLSNPAVAAASAIAGEIINPAKL